MSDYESRVQALEAEGITRSDAQGIVDAADIVECEYCPLCDGPPVALGTLGSYDHYRCRNCGGEWSTFNEYENA